MDNRTRTRLFMAVCFAAAALVLVVGTKNYLNSHLSSYHAPAIQLNDLPSNQFDPQNEALTSRQQIVEFAKSLKKQGKTIAIALANDAYLPLANSWLCNTKFMGVHEQVSVLVPDRTSRDKLKHNWPDIHVFNIETSQGAVSGPKDFTTVGFQRITYLRSLIIKELLLHDLDVFVFEFDAIWFRSPINEFKEKLGDADIAFVEVTNTPGEVGVGIMLIRSSASTKTVYTQMINRFDRLLNDTQKDKDGKKISTRLNDQIFLTEMVKHKFAGVRVVPLPVRIYADGNWYNAPKEKRNPDPVIINNNFIIGVSTKINRAKQVKHWFWNSGNTTCMDNHVRELTQKR